MTLSATGTASAAPDMAVVSLGVVGTGVDAAQAMAENNAQMQAVFAKLDEIGIPVSDTATSGLSLNPRYDRPEINGQTPKVTGYIVNNQLDVTIYDVASVGTVLDQLVQAGANTVQSVRFDIEDKSALETIARQDAAAKVNGIAREYAQALGTDIVGILNVTENSQFPMPQMRGLAMESGVPVAAGDVDVTVTLNVTYEITGSLD